MSRETLQSRFTAFLATGLSGDFDLFGFDWFPAGDCVHVGDILSNLAMVGCLTARDLQHSRRNGIICLNFTIASYAPNDAKKARG